MVDTKKEVWKEVTINSDYLVSNMGRVKSKERLVPCKNGFRRKREHLLTPYDNHGYLHVGFKIGPKHVNPAIHQLVIWAFKGKRNYPEWEIDHINGNSHDNRLVNLEYVSSKENTKRAYTLNLQNKETLSLSNRKRIATPEEIIYIKKQFVAEGRKLGGRKNKDFYQRMATKFGYKDPQSIYHILLGRTNRFFGKDIVQTTNINNGSENYSGKG